MSKNFVKLPTGDVEIDHLREMYTDLNFTKFEFLPWRPRPALIDKSTKSTRLYTGQKFDSAYFDLVEDGWSHDHCEICFTRISEGSNGECEYGYFNGGVWVCKNCFEMILSSKDLEKSLQEFVHYEK